jgi:diaminohydroxyphosphoribosylaminopyrimidine deaminase/5-amino-6-(5-phosphoribosylamino)uracil reductase
MASSNSTSVIPPASLSSRTDADWMRYALELAKQGQGYVEPNPMVGCVVVRGGECVGAGYHERFGGPHAEVRAFESCGAELFEGSTVYVTLEPCSHFGKTPPCVELLLKHRPSRVVVAMSDPFEQVSGAGIRRLREAQIETVVGVLEDQARALNAPYLKRIRTGLPWVIAKWAMTLDGAMATVSGDSKWISGEESRRQVHRLRGRVDAILVGSDTVLADDPMLTARLEPADGEVLRRATRVVLDRRMRIPLSSGLVQTAREVPVKVVTLVPLANDMQGLKKLEELTKLGVVVEGLDRSLGEDSKGFLTGALASIAKQGGTNVLLEGGARVFGGFFEAGLVDQVECYVAPKVLGGLGRRTPVEGSQERKWISQAVGFASGEWESIGGDMHFSGIVNSASEPEEK